MTLNNTEQYKFVRKGHRLQTFISCINCNKKRWVSKQSIIKSNHFTGLCRTCSSRANMINNTNSKHPDFDRVERKLGIKLIFYRDKKGQLVTDIMCPVCKNKRQVTEYNIFRSTNWTARCAKCVSLRAKENPNWRGGRVKLKTGYILIYIRDDDQFISMRDKRNYTLEHRYIMAKKLGRPLERHEVVHHLNGIKDDNREKNLAIVGGEDSTLKHNVITRQQIRIRELEGLLRQKGLDNE